MKGRFRSILVATALCGLAVSAIADVKEVPGEYPTIQAAINAASDGDEIIVAPETYTEAIDFMGKAVTVRSSAGADETVISATGLAKSVITCANDEGPDSVLIGFTITGGEGTARGFDLVGGGAYVYGASPTIIDCVFTGNYADAGVTPLPVPECGAQLVSSRFVTVRSRTTKRPSLAMEGPGYTIISRVRPLRVVSFATIWRTAKEARWSMCAVLRSS
jgi:hypothetical protein